MTRAAGDAGRRAGCSCQVLVEICGPGHGPALGLDHPHSQRAREQDDGPERAPSQTLQGREQAGQAPSHAPEASGGRGEALPSTHESVSWSAVKIARLGIRTRLRAFIESVRDLRFRPAVRQLARGKPDDYREYLDVQLERTLSKRENDPGAGARELVRRVVELGSLSESSSVLCVGCRNTIELDLFASAGVGDVVGIDLVSQRPDVLVMDMHDMNFDGRTVRRRVRVAFSRALLRRGGGRPRAGTSRPSACGRRCRGTARYTREPSRPGSRSRVSTISARPSPPAVAEELWADEQPARTPTNDQGTPVARVVFRLEAAELQSTPKP